MMYKYTNLTIALKSDYQKVCTKETKKEIWQLIKSIIEFEENKKINGENYEIKKI